jgi:phosphoadenosine phosphosulfate reductase
MLKATLHNTELKNAQDTAKGLFESVDLQNPLAVLAATLNYFGSHVALASSFSLEDMALIDMILKLEPSARIIALDTGRLNDETYECAEKIRLKYGCKIEWYFPDEKKVEKLLTEKGLYSFRESIEDRQECCHIRKVEPLTRALNGLGAWITGQRQQQSSTRSNLQIVEVDEAHGFILKINPLAYWSFERAKEYVNTHSTPYNAPCTRASKPGEDERAGRWWWEESAHKECGIHVVTTSSPTTVFQAAFKTHSD